MPALYEITNEYADALHAYETATDEASEAEALSRLVAIEGDFTQKAVSVAMFIRNLETTAEQIKAAAENQIKRANAMLAKAENATTYLHSNMIRCKVNSIDNPHFILRLRNLPARVEVVDESQIPAEFMRVPEPPAPKPDKKAILDAFKQTGEIISGVHIITDAQNVEIK